MILILDFGSQYTQLIARRIRESKVYCEIVPFNISYTDIVKKNPTGIILSGGPSNVYDSRSPHPDIKLWDIPIPILGICYGLQLIAYHYKGQVKPAKRREYGLAEVKLKSRHILFKKIPTPLSVWMSHGDHIARLPKGFLKLGSTSNAASAVIGNDDSLRYGLQFHPEVRHTAHGTAVLKNFIHLICREKPTWSMKSFVKTEVHSIRARVGKGKVLCALSGGVDSSVVSLLINKAVGTQLHCVFVDNGVLRLGEKERLIQRFKHIFKQRLHVINSRKSFLKLLQRVEDPERKRKIIGNEFIRIFEREAEKIGGISYLVQGTLYPDVIESVSVKGPSATIKTHHNVGGLPDKMKLKLIEPLRFLFKDEVRLLGKELGLSDECIQRHPFPGPGMAIRILGPVTERRLHILRQADWIVEGEIRRCGWYNRVWQAFAVLLPIKTVGVMGDERTYENVITVRVVESTDGMTADWVKLPHNLLGIISNRIINEVKGVNRVVYDISSKPPATIEWE
ncbi:MAG: glutamine-hydrolyzing GMP synthase [bacterium]